MIALVNADLDPLDKLWELMGWEPDRWFKRLDKAMIKVLLIEAEGKERIWQAVTRHGRRTQAAMKERDWMRA